MGVEPATDTEGGRLAVVGEVDGHLRVGEESHQETTNEAGDAVSEDDTEGVIDLREGANLAQVVPGHPDNGRAEEADTNGAEGVHEAGRRGDAHQTTDHAVDGTEEGGLLLAAKEHVEGQPGQHTNGGGEVGVQHG